MGDWNIYVEYGHQKYVTTHYINLKDIQMSWTAVKCDVSTTALLLWIILFVANFHGIQTEVASSVSAMTSLISQEENLIEHLGKVLDLATTKAENKTWIARIKRYLDCIKTKHGLIANAEGDLVHPVIGFRLVRRLVKDWNDVTSILDPSPNHVDIVRDNVQTLYDNLQGMRDVMSKWRRWPTAQDVKDTAMGLIRIGQTYGMYPRTAQQDRFNNASDTLSSEIMSIRNLFHKPDDVTNSNTRISDIYTKTMHDSTISYHCESNCKGQAGNHRTRGMSKNHTDKNNQTIKVPQSSKNLSNNNNMSVDVNIKSDNVKHELKAKQSCHYDYKYLDYRDFMFITNAAISQKLKDEAHYWVDHFESEFYHGKVKQNESVRKKIDQMRSKIKAIKKTDQKSDEVMKNYFKQCREATEVPPISPTSNPLYCSWRHSNPYLRYKVELLHLSPDIYQFHDVIASGEIGHIKLLANAKLVPSGLDLQGDTKDEARYWRVSQTAWFTDETPVLQRLSERVGQLTGLDTGPVSDVTSREEHAYSEPLQVVNYGLGGLYGPHLDTLHTPSHDSGSSLQHTGDRLATWMFYLGDVQVGGLTVFPRIGVSVKPIKGSAILWYNLLRNGRVDMRTVHAGCPVVVGDKWVANKWVRETAQWKTRPCLLDPSL